MEAEHAPIREKAAKYDIESKAWAAERTFLQVGLTDPEAQDIARILHERIPEAERPALDVWLKEIKADPSKAPKALQPYLQAQTPANPPPAGGNPPPANPPPGAPPAAPRVETSPGASVAVTPQAIKAAYQEALRTGDWKAYDALKAQVAAERRG